MEVATGTALEVLAVAGEMHRVLLTDLAGVIQLLESLFLFHRDGQLFLFVEQPSGSTRALTGYGAVRIGVTLMFASNEAPGPFYALTEGVLVWPSIFNPEVDAVDTVFVSHWKLPFELGWLEDYTTIRI